jgi:hypothetical protein
MTGLPLEAQGTAALGEAEFLLDRLENRDSMIA